jgi:hypothetical protein
MPQAPHRRRSPADPRTRERIGGPRVSDHLSALGTVLKKAFALGPAHRLWSFSSPLHRLIRSPHHQTVSGEPPRARAAGAPRWAAPSSATSSTYPVPGVVYIAQRGDSLSLGTPLDWSLWVVARRFSRIAVLPTQRWVISGTSRVLSVRCTAKSDLYCSSRNLSVCSGSRRRREFHHLLLLIQRVVWMWSSRV